MQRFLLAVAVVGLGWASPRAAAGPIDWEYRVTLQDPERTGKVYLGKLFQPGQSEAEATYLTAPIPSPAPNASVQSGSQTDVRLFGLSKKAYQTTTDASVVNSWSHYVVELELIDRASGLSSTTGFSVLPTYVAGMTDAFAPTVDGDLVLSAAHNATLVVGGSRFDVTVRGTDTDSNVWVTADVTLSPAADTPEPATLLMAGLGLGGIAVARLRRRR